MTDEEYEEKVGWMLVRKHKGGNGEHYEFLDATRSYCPLEDGVFIKAEEMAHYMIETYPNLYSSCFPVWHTKKQEKMNANAKFLNEAKELEAKWNKSGLLDGIERKWERQVTAKMLECQRLYNETGAWDCCDECRERENSSN